ncbi:MAG: hypothetical protein Q9225_007737, partial [Loekoesia sp. 1 TL-2023]
MPAYHFTAQHLHSPRMDARAFSLPTSKRSGHPIFPSSGSMPPSYNPPTCETASDSPPGINISLQGTWKPVPNGHPSANIEVLDLTERYGYKPPMKPKIKPKNALREGLKPTKNLELPLKRTIYEISSGEEDDDDDDETISEPSPLRAKRPRMTKLGNLTNGCSSALEELQAAAGTDASADLGLPSHTESMTHTGHQSTIFNTQRPTNNIPPSPNPSLSSSTERGGNNNNPAVPSNHQPPTPNHTSLT